MPDRVKSLGEVDSSKNRLRLVKTIPNGLKKMVKIEFDQKFDQKFDQEWAIPDGNRPDQERIELDSRKKSGWDRMLRSKSFGMQEVRQR